MACMERLCPKGVTFFRPQVYERVGILLVEVYGKVGKSVILVCKKARGLINAFHFFCWGEGGVTPTSNYLSTQGEYQTPTMSGCFMLRN